MNCVIKIGKENSLHDTDCSDYDVSYQNSKHHPYEQITENNKDHHNICAPHLYVEACWPFALKQCVSFYVGHHQGGFINPPRMPSRMSLVCINVPIKFERRNTFQRTFKAFKIPICTMYHLLQCQCNLGPDAR